jgi:hypothetical protein
MYIGQIVEQLIDIKNEQEPLSQDEEALIEACNLLDKLPRTADGVEYLRVLEKIISKNEAGA